MKGETVMKKKVWTGLLLTALCFLLLLPAALGETRQGVIALEGQEETIEETLYTSPLGFSFWYANERLEANPDEADGREIVTVKALYSDDHMTLSLIPEKEAEEYVPRVAELSAASRVQMDVYRTLKNGTFTFLTVIAENGQYLRAVGQYSEEAAEGNAKFFQRVLDSVALISECDAEMLRLLPGQWADAYEGAEIVLTLKENGEMSLSYRGTDGAFAYTYTYTGAWSYETVPNQSGQFALSFTSTDNPLYAQSAYSVKCVYAAYTESWVENDTLITYLLLNPPIECSGVSPFEDIFGSNDAALHREQGPNMRVVNCNEFVSLRQTRSTSSARLAKVPLGALVLAFPEAGEKNGFISCVYHDQEGFILSKYLQPTDQ